MNQKLMPLAVLLGLLGIAAAIYFGLRAQTPVAQTPHKPADLTLANASAQPWVAAGMGSAAPALTGAYAAASGSLLAPAQAHTPGTFKTAWRSQWRGAAAQCELDKHVTLPKERWYVELPLELRVTADGVISAARRFAQLREIGDDGTYHKASLSDDAVSSLTKCYMNAVTSRVRFPPATAGSTLQVWVRIARNLP